MAPIGKNFVSQLGRVIRFHSHFIRSCSFESRVSVGAKFDLLTLDFYQNMCNESLFGSIFKTSNTCWRPNQICFPKYEPTWSGNLVLELLHLYPLHIFCSWKPSLCKLHQAILGYKCSIWPQYFSWLLLLLLFLWLLFKDKEFANHHFFMTLNFVVGLLNREVKDHFKWRQKNFAQTTQTRSWWWKKWISMIWTLERNVYLGFGKLEYNWYIYTCSRIIGFSLQYSGCETTFPLQTITKPFSSFENNGQQLNHLKHPK